MFIFFYFSVLLQCISNERIQQPRWFQNKGTADLCFWDIYLSIHVLMNPSDVAEITPLVRFIIRLLLQSSCHSLLKPWGGSKSKHFNILPLCKACFYILRRNSWFDTSPSYNLVNALFFHFYCVHFNLLFSIYHLDLIPRIWLISSIFPPYFSSFHILFALSPPTWCFQTVNFPFCFYKIQ